MLICAPRFDEATQYSYKWALKLAQEIGGDQTLLLEKDATREKFEKEIGKHNTFVFYDHGDQDRLVAQGGTSNVLDTKNVDLIGDKEVYTMACLSAKKLGVEAWKRTAVFWGYTEVFGFTTEEEDLFCEVAMYGLVLMKKQGFSPKEALQRTKEKFSELIGRAKDVWTRIWLQHDRDALVCYNGEEPKPEPYPCAFRRFAVKKFGMIGWFITRKFALGFIVALIGWGITIHAVGSELYSKGGYAEIFAFQGEWIGLALNLIGILVIFQDYVRELYQLVKKIYRT